MSLTLQDVEKIAHLARLELTRAEKAQYLEQLSAILDYADMLNELDLEGIEPTAHAIAQQNILRDDVVTPSLPLDDVLFNAPQQAQNQFAELKKLNITEPMLKEQIKEVDKQLKMMQQNMNPSMMALTGGRGFRQPSGKRKMPRPR